MYLLICSKFQAKILKVKRYLLKRYLFSMISQALTLNLELINMLISFIDSRFSKTQIFNFRPTIFEYLFYEQGIFALLEDFLIFPELLRKFLYFCIICRPAISQVCTYENVITLKIVYPKDVDCNGDSD